ncbi:MAG TPA: ABC transporter permease [Tepidisphaeraceae bacterium]|nr:ABC transporter permease [Tepidisphaeraceae bacterium]
MTEVRIDYATPSRPVPWSQRLLAAARTAGKKELAIGLLLFTLCVIVAILNPRFLSATNLRNQASQVGLFGIFAIGMGIVIITGGIDLSVGSAFALQGVLLSIALREWHVPSAIAVVGSLALMVVLGLLNAFFITKVRLQPFIVTLCGLMFFRSMARFITHDETKGFGDDSSFPVLRLLAAGNIGPVPMPFVLLIVVSVIMWVVLHRSVYGRYLYAVGRNDEAARYSGINTKLVVGGAYVLSMLLAGISGIILAFWTPSISPNDHGLSYELFGIAAAVLGGCSLRGGEGSILGIVLGTALLQVLRNMVILLGIPSSLELAVTASVILIGVTADEMLSTRRRNRKLATPVTITAPVPVGTPG